MMRQNPAGSSHGVQAEESSRARGYWHPQRGRGGMQLVPARYKQLTEPAAAHGMQPPPEGTWSREEECLSCTLRDHVLAKELEGKQLLGGGFISCLLTVRGLDEDITVFQKENHFRLKILIFFSPYCHCKSLFFEFPANELVIVLRVCAPPDPAASHRMGKATGSLGRSGCVQEEED